MEPCVVLACETRWHNVETIDVTSRILGEQLWAHDVALCEEHRLALPSGLALGDWESLDSKSRGILTATWDVVSDGPATRAALYLVGDELEGPVARAGKYRQGETPPTSEALSNQAQQAVASGEPAKGYFADGIMSVAIPILNDERAVAIVWIDKGPQAASFSDDEVARATAVVQRQNG